MPEEYIKRTDAVKIAEKYGLANGSVLGRHTGLADCIASEISELPASDVAEVVRCKDCKHRTEYGNCGHPRRKGVLPSAYPYDGDRRVDHLALEAETTQIIDGCCTACGELMDCIEAAEYKFCPYCGKWIV